MKPVKRRRHIFLKLLLIFIMLTAILLLDSNTRIVTTEYMLYYKTLPEEFDGFRIAALSDIHAAEFGKGNKRLISKVEEAKPDIIAVLGDFLDAHEKDGTDRQLEIAEILVSGLIPIAPVYFVTGNHEWDSDGYYPLLEMFMERGVTVLHNSYDILEEDGAVIVLAGRDDPNGPADMISREKSVESIYASQGSVFIAMMEHRNYYLEEYAALGVDLILSGHAHGGMVRLPFTDGLIGPNREWLPSYTNGVYEQGNTKMVVSRGIGNSTGFPRFLNNPHIAVVILKKDIPAAS